MSRFYALVRRCSIGFKFFVRSGVIDLIGFAGLALFAISAFISPATRDVVWALCLMAFCFLALAFCPTARSALRKDSVFRFFLFFIVYVIAETLWGIFKLPESTPLQLRYAGKSLLLFGFLPVAWWLKADLKRINLVLILALISLLIGMQPYVSSADIVFFQTGKQTGFQMTAGCSGVISASAILGLLLFAGRILGGPRRTVYAGLKIIGWLVGLYLGVYMLVASQHRSSWIALIIVLPLVLGCQYFLSAKGQGNPIPRFVYLPLFAFGLLIAGIALNADSIVDRMGPDRETVALILQGKTEQLPHSSFAYRYHLWRFGVEKWLESPVVGWGPGATKQLILHSNRPELFNLATGQWLGHLHNTYLEILLRFGIIGAIVIATGAWTIIGNVVRAGKISEPLGDYYLFVRGSIGLIFIWCAFAVQIMADYWIAYWLILMGVGYTFVLYNKSASEERKPPDRAIFGARA